MLQLKKENLRQKDIKDWEKKEFTQALKGLKSKLRITTDHLKQVQKMDEGKLNEGKETIFDVAARVMKDKQNQNYKSKVGMVKVDMQSANLLTKVWKKVNPKMKKILSDLGEKNPAGLMKTLWAVVK
jgi:NADH:ubiquinone oxidoreductase subunit C